MEVRLKYGTEKVSVDLGPAARVRVLEPPRFDPAPGEALVRSALANPLGSPPLAEIARGKERVVIVVSDKTRSTRTDVFLPILLEVLDAAGVGQKKITILVATGSHAGHTPEEMDRLLGPSIRSSFSVVDHDAKDAAAHVQLGRTSRGTPVELDRRAVESDCLILTGAVGFHYFAGFGGGKKALLPGVASYEAILANHRLMLVEGRPDDLIHPMCASGVLEGNPIHEDMVEAARRIRPAFLLNTILTPDGRIAHVVAGDLWKAHRSGVDIVRSLYSVPADRKAPLVIASCGGHPKDINFIQAHKSIHHAFDLLADRGVLIVLAECSQGIGSDDFLPWFSTLDLRAVGRRLFPEFTVNAHTAYVAMRKALSGKIILVTRLEESIVRSMGMTRAESVEDALRLAAGALGRIDEVLVLPSASVTVPQPASGCREDRTS